MTPLSHLNRAELESLFEEMFRALHFVKALDKTLEYDYHGKRSLNRNGEPPAPGKRWSTPYIIASKTIKHINDVNNINKYQQ